jgi:hypothetical protein
MNSNSMSLPSLDLRAESTGSSTGAEIDAFRWLLILGFPLPVAAATAMPELFTVESPRRPAR